MLSEQYLDSNLIKWYILQTIYITCIKFVKFIQYLY